MSNVKNILADIATMSASQIANTVGASWDASVADWFTDIRDAVIDAVGEYDDADDFRREVLEDYSGRASEIADGAVPIYTYDLWTTFVGVGGWSVDTSDYGPIEDMDSGARVALYALARDVVTFIAGEIVEALES